MSPTFDNPGDDPGTPGPLDRPVHLPLPADSSVAEPIADPISEPIPAPSPANPAERAEPRPAGNPWNEEDPRKSGEMPFLAHLEELRWVLMHSLIACAVGAIGGWLLAPRVLEDVIHRTVGRAVVLSPLEAFNERFKLALILGLFISLPIVFYRIWSFIVPGLLKRERSWILPMAMTSMGLFALGSWAAYGYVVPLVVDVLKGFQTPSMVAQIQLGSLLGFVYNMALACGIVFQLPLVTMTLTAIGLVTPGFLLKQWRIAIVLSFFVTAIITPGDVVTAQLVMGVPMTALYFLSVGLSYFVARRRRASTDRTEATDVPQP
jgi:sec-independent protein translocase protein TatC